MTGMPDDPSPPGRTGRLTTSPAGRLLRLGGVAGRVGLSLLVDRALASIGARGDERRRETLLREATRVVEALSRLKGAAMKVGQMLSLHEGLLPAEVTEVLRLLQRKAPPIPFEIVREEIEVQIPQHEEIFTSIEPEAFAAASIGQVHRAVLRDGRRAAVKIQYPAIDRVVRADLDNLRLVLGGIVRMFADVDFEPIWAELRDRLLEELDYRREAANMRAFAERFADDPRLVIPAVIDEATTASILTMEFVDGRDPDAACAAATPQELRDRWGQALFSFVLRGVLVDRLLHADPNLSNFAFLDGGRVAVFDFGCVKSVPEPIARGYAELLLAVIEGRPRDIPGILDRFGVRYDHGGPIGLELIEPYFRLFAAIVRETPPYRFGDDPDLYPRLLELGLQNASEAASIRFPRDIVFVDRALAGTLGNLCRLRAAGPWRTLAADLARRALD
ncbi:MAG: AarF/ABC1/UbiB kinase family protein [Acidobacteriota bacterium]